MVIERKGPVVAGLFYDIAKMCFANLEIMNNSRLAQLSVIFQQAFSLKLSFYEAESV